MTIKRSELVANIFKAMSHPARVQIIRLLKEGSLCVCEILPRIELEQSNTSQHLAILKNQGILSSKKEGTMVFYEVKSPEVLEMLSLAEQMLVRQIEETRSVVENSL